MRNLFQILGILLSTVFFISGQAEARRGILLMPHLITPQIGVRDNTATKLLYYGGPIISQVKVVSVNWNSNVHPTIQAEMPQFYTDYVNSNQMEWINEYKTDIKAINGREGTNQRFSKGSLIGVVTLNPKNKSLKLTDEDVAAELKHQVDQSALPRPDNDTLYMIHFPKDIKITIEGMGSCTSFGGYHYAKTDQQYGNFFYSVLPDCSYSSSSEDRLSTMTEVASHELMEAITDPFPTPGSNPAYPQAWNTKDGSEISDLCAWNGFSFQGSKRSYHVTRNWSNAKNSCITGLE
ncbi:MAG: hypothetical protein BroJett040_08410 [Oligoflexia bacterium]|nr:MAG: hypothetical protein BroJett040_08410 [Oligoflexia bacterium]